MKVYLSLTHITILLTMMLAACATQPGTTASVNESAQQSIPVEITTTVGDQHYFSVGDEVQFLLSLGSDAYIYMYFVDNNGVVKRILPSELRDGHFFKRGYFLTVPDYENDFRFIIGQSLAKGVVWVFGSDVDLKIDDGLAIDEIESVLISSTVAEYGVASFEVRVLR